MHATSLQGFGYGDVVHQFKKRYNTEQHRCYRIRYHKSEVIN
ncbi:MAG: hypothetical protein O4965_02110 [Trichodesmium sp. St19_bin1]|nr:hypothetical protein [Trichodesmium sp. St2_bin2_1]MDE5119008.1 hypothetical protein [Trichodesmium sp. St19_bin1]